MCWDGKSRRAAARGNSLKPHCVSRTPRTPPSTATKKWKPYMSTLRYHLRCTRARAPRQHCAARCSHAGAACLCHGLVLQVRSAAHGHHHAAPWLRALRLLRLLHRALHAIKVRNIRGAIRIHHEQVAPPRTQHALSQWMSTLMNEPRPWRSSVQWYAPRALHRPCPGSETRA